MATILTFPFAYLPANSNSRANTGNIEGLKSLPALKILPTKQHWAQLTVIQIFAKSISTRHVRISCNTAHIIPQLILRYSATRHVLHRN